MKTQSEWNDYVKNELHISDEQLIGFYIEKESKIVPVKLKGGAAIFNNQLYVEGTEGIFEYKVSDFQYFDMVPIIIIGTIKYNLTTEYIPFEHLLLFKLEEQKQNKEEI